MKHIVCGLLFAVIPLPVLAELQIERTPERLARGEYLVNFVLSCNGCHSERALDRYGFPPREGRALAGGIIFREYGPRAITPNITSTALADWTDQEVFDAITRGIGRDGRTLHPSMPYAVYGQMEREELYSIIAYLRDMPGVDAGPYPSEFPGEHKPASVQLGAIKRPAAGADAALRGKYLVTIGTCSGCHDQRATDASGHDAVTATLAGGREFAIPGVGRIRAANLTPDVSTGIGAYTEEAFVARVRAMQGAEQHVVETGNANTVMHWWAYAYMEEEDLAAIYAYLKTLPPVTNAVTRFEPMPGERTAGLNWSDQEEAQTASIEN